MMALGAGRVAAFSLIGPFELYQAQVISYQFPPDIGGPQNYDDAYRVNTPVIYYTYDPDFLGYFGSNGVAAIDAAFAIMNTVSNVSSYSADLSEWPLEAQSYNYRAQALSLFDLKSVALNLLVEQMGLAEPDRYTWTLHDRLVGPGGCPSNVTYLVIKRNFDPVASTPDLPQASSYVNGTLYSYYIDDICTGAPWLADAVEFPVDPLASTFTAVASVNIQYGAYYTGLTRDDVGGLRWMLRTNYMKTEAAGESTLTFITNTTPQLLFTSNLFEFLSIALTNDPATLSAFYPDLQLGASTPIFTNVVTTNTIFYFTNFPFDPFGTPAWLVSATVKSTNVSTYYNHQLLNVFITPNNQLVSNTQVPLVPGHTTSNRVWGIWTTNISTTACPMGTAYGTICTNVAVSNLTVRAYFGDYYILPSNLCSVAIISTQLIAAITVTNATIVATNAPGTTNTANEFFSQTPTYTFNQYIYQVRPVVCPSNSVALRQGIEQVRFVRRDFDSLLNRFFYPITNDYTINAITNSQVVPQTIRRVVLSPDLLITADDLLTTPADAVIGGNIAARSINYRSNSISFGGTLEIGNVFTFNNAGPSYLNATPFNLEEATQAPFITWGSFDGSTNAPVVYGNGASLIALEYQVLIQISPNTAALPDAQVGVNYTNAFSGFTAMGGSPPYTWGISPESAGGLPAGLAFNPSTGQIIGVPSVAGLYDFTIRLTDTGSRFVDRPYSLNIVP